MLSPGVAAKMNRNIRLFGIYKVFTKRVFLPLTTIYATQQAGLDIQQIGLTASAASLLSLLCDTPTGYWADIHGRKKSAQVGAALAAIGSLIFVFSTNFWGILLASLVTAVGYSFLYGSMEALIHDSLVVLKRESDYAKLASRAQALSLVGNSALVALVPLLYPIDKRLPFIAGFIAYVLLYLVASFLTEPNVEHDPEVEERRFVRTVRKLFTRKTAAFFICVGLVYALYTGSVDVFNLAQLELGLAEKYFGLLYAAASMLGAIIGLFVHRLKRLSLKQYALFDMVINIMPFIAYGVIKSLPLALITFVINFGFWRYEQIMYQHYVLQIYGTSRYKATLISMMVNFRSFHEVWIAIAASTAARHFGILNSIGYASIFVIALVPVLLMSISQFEMNARAEAGLANH